MLVRLASLIRFCRLEQARPKVLGDPGPVGVDRLERTVGPSDANPAAAVWLHAGGASKGNDGSRALSHKVGERSRW